MVYKLKYAAAIAMIGFLSVYHLSRIYIFLFMESGEAASLLSHGQAVLRAFIIITLVYVAMKRRHALLWMWVAIGALIATQYMQLLTTASGALPLSTYMGYLRGFIFPALITIIYTYGAQSILKNQPQE